MMFNVQNVRCINKNYIQEKRGRKMADCWDCMYSVMKGQILKCKRKGTDVSERSSICSNFADSNAKCCDDCEYYEFGIFSRWNDHGKCKLTGQGRWDDDVACSRFIEG